MLFRRDRPAVLVDHDRLPMSARWRQPPCVFTHDLLSRGDLGCGEISLLPSIPAMLAAHPSRATITGGNCMLGQCVMVMHWQGMMYTRMCALGGGAAAQQWQSTLGWVAHCPTLLHAGMPNLAGIRFVSLPA